MSAVDLLIAAGVALLAGGINSIAGGGSLILFPTLVALGLGTVQANVTNSIAQWPGYVGGVLGFRAEYAGQRDRLIRFGITAALGGTAAGPATRRGSTSRCSWPPSTAATSAVRWG